MGRNVLLRYGLALAVAVVALTLAAFATAAPQAHILRIDPRASLEDGAPLLDTVIELVQHKPLSDLTAQCSAFTGDAELTCLSDKLQQPRALYDTFAFPKDKALFTITVDGRDLPADLVSVERWSDAKKSNKSVGTAWLLLIDASGQMGSRFSEGKFIAKAFVEQMGPHDIVDVMFFDDRSVVRHSKWTKDKGAAGNFIDGVAGVFPKKGRTKSLFNIVKQGVTDAFQELGNAGSKIDVPLHQAAVIISDGNTGADVSSAAPTALQLKDYLTKGRFPEDNLTLPKSPLPIVSIWLPNKATEEVFQNARQFMENLANTEIGGAFFVVNGGQAGNAKRIAQAVNTRFDAMNLVKWKVSCVAPSVTQTFKLLFKSTDPPIAGDNFVDVPLGLDPTQWPLAIDVEATEKHAADNPVHPGGKVRIFGDFCWGTDHERAELYLIPKNQPAPQSLKGRSLEEAKKAQRSLIESNMRAKVVGGSDTYVEFEIPDTEKFLRGKDEDLTAQMIVYDSTAKRTSAITADKILTLKAQKKPHDIWLIGGLVFGGVVLVLLAVNLFRGGGNRRRRSSATPRPVVAGAPGMAAPIPGPGPVMPAGPMGASPAGYAPAPIGVPATRAILTGAPGSYTIEAREVKVGRDPGLCEIVLTEPRISGMHATLKVEGGQLLVRDEGSNNGTYVAGARLAAYAWQPVAAGVPLRFGPIEFDVRFE